MTEWTDPRYAAVVAHYRTRKAAAGAPKPRRGRTKKYYGDPFVIVIDPATRTPYTASR